MQTIALIDYGSGNLRSAEKALWEAARRLGKRRDIRTTADPDFVAQADRIVLPGVGAFAACMTALSERNGLIEAMTEAVRRRSAPFLGICVGMQLLATRGLEFGETGGLNWIEGDVARLTPSDPHAKVPHMGWNDIRSETVNPVVGDGAKPFYFTHSFAFAPKIPSDVAASVDHGGRFAAAVARDNMVGVQFHPEKSQAAGLDLIGRFLLWDPA